jgi:hypothetical protein
MGEIPTKTWTQVVAPLVRRFEVAAAINGQAVWNAKGSAAMAKVITEMATKLDTAIRQQEQPNG